ncbi:MAG: MMPL family transporter [Candidatus Sericytochromatia bacterium]|nr:MMPL family transporter [Candidatus Sericytochromatia bacterium]
MFNHLAAWLIAHRKAVLAAWLVAVLATAWMAVGAGQVLFTGSADLEGSRSRAVAQALRSEFRSALGDGLIVVLEPGGRALDGPALQGVVAQVSAALARDGQRVEGPFDHATIMRDGVAHPQRVWFVSPPRQDGDPVAATRGRLAEAREALAQLDPGALLAVTGGAAVNADIGQVSKADGQRAELLALPLTALALLLAFRAPLAAALPLACAGSAIGLTLAAVFGVAQVTVLSDLLENLVTMIGLAVGIDYALLVVERWREERAAHGPEAAVVRALGFAGPSIVASGAAVLCGMVALAFGPLLELRSMALGGVLVVLFSVAAALTLLPALLATFPRAIEWPGWAEGPDRPEAHRLARLRERLAGAVTAAPRRALAAGALVAALLMLPALQFRLGAPDMDDLPAHMESARGLAAIKRMDIGNAVFDVRLLVRTTDGSPVLAPRHLPALVAWSHGLEADARVRRVLSPVTSRPGATLFENAVLFSSWRAGLERLPPVLRGFVSDDGQAMVVAVLPAAGVSSIAIQRMAEAYATRAPQGPFTLTVGGQPTYLNELSARMDAATWPILAFVGLSTALLLGWAFRSVLVPLKAIVLNLVSVGAGYGVITVVCQWGWGCGLVGLEHPLARVPPFVPLLLFCIMFGLSMDYEVFMVSRIREGVLAGLDQRRAVVEGLSHAWPLITRAACIMLIVFGAFAWAEMLVIKVLGLGMATAVLVDATLVRMVLGPALLMVAGRYNWWPGQRGMMSPRAPLEGPP